MAPFAVLFGGEKKRDRECYGQGDLPKKGLKHDGHFWNDKTLVLLQSQEMPQLRAESFNAKRRVNIHTGQSVCESQFVSFCVRKWQKKKISSIRAK